MASIASAPFVRTLSDSANYDVTVKPYLSQLPDLSSRVLAAIKTKSLDEVVRVYANTNPFLFGLYLSLIFGALFLVAAEVNRNYSQVDRFWSILPGFYILHYNVWSRLTGLSSARLDLALLCAAIWGSRLTFNFWRKGGYQIGGEDYRWPLIKEQIGPVGMFVLNLTFISFGQSVLLFLVTSPAYILLNVSRIQPELTLPDIIFTSLILVLIVVETVADQQQWNYQQTKHGYLKSAKIPADSKFTQEDLDRGFNVSGLWSWSRHPNLACEQAIWLTYYHWAAFSSHNFINYALAGTVGYILIFAGSTPLTEKISAGKYPQYKEYQQLVGKFLPGVLGGAWKSKKN